MDNAPDADRDGDPRSEFRARRELGAFDLERTRDKIIERSQTILKYLGR